MPRKRGSAVRRGEEPELSAIGAECDECATSPAEQGAASEESAEITSDGAIRFVKDRKDIPKLKSVVDPSKRRPNYKEPTPIEEWRPEWRLRKREARGYEFHREAVLKLMCESMISEEEIAALPRDASGRPLKTEALFEMVIQVLSSGLPVKTFAQMIGLPRTTLMRWIDGTPVWKERFEAESLRSADVLMEKAQEIAESPQIIQEEYLSYDGKGNLTRRDVKRADGVYQRKLAATLLVEIAKRRNPDKYGDRKNVKVDSSIGSRIAAARWRGAGKNEPPEDIEAK